MTLKTFMPAQAATKTIAVTTVSAVTSLGTLGQFSNAVRQRVVTGGSEVFFEYGDANTVATVAGSASMAAGATETFTKGAATHIATICATGTATMYATPGEGL